MMTSRSDERFTAAGIAAFAVVVLLWLGLSIIAVLRQGTWADEVGYVLKSWWYVSGAVQPYSAEDATWYQPLIFYVIGPWQWVAGQDVAASRSLTVLITAINIGLLAGFLRRLDCGVWPIIFAIIVFALTEDSVFYFSSATPYAFSITLQLIALHLLLTMRQSASVAVIAAFAIVLTMIYLLRINLISFIALSLAIAWVRAGRDRWWVYLASATVVVVAWSVLALVWGRRFMFISLWLPNVNVLDLLSHAGLFAPFFPHALTLSRQMLLSDSLPHDSLADFLAYAFQRDIVMNWFVAHHIVPVAASILALGALVVRRVPHRGWIAIFVGAYVSLLLFHHLGAQSYCPICIQAYANYFNYLGALAGGLALSGLSGPALRRQAVRRVVCIGVIVASLGLAAWQSWSLAGAHGLPSIRNQQTSLSGEVHRLGDVLGTLLPANLSVGLVSSDPRIPLALAQAGIRVPPIDLTLTSSYRRLNDGLTIEQRRQAIEELGDLSFWTDAIAENWMRDQYAFLLVQRRPDAFPSWLVWAPDAPLVKRGLAACFEKVDGRSFDDMAPPLAIDLYRRTKRGEICVND